MCGKQGVGVAQRTRPGVVAGQHQAAFAGVDGHRRGAQGRQLRCAQRGAAHRHAGQAVRGRHGDGAGGGLAGIADRQEADFLDRGLTRGAGVAVDRGDARHTVGAAVDGDIEGACTPITVSILNRIGKMIYESLPSFQGIDRRIGVVQRVGVIAVGSHVKATITACKPSKATSKGVGTTVRTDNHSDNTRCICTQCIVSHQIGGYRIRHGVFRHDGGIRYRRRSTVNDLNRQGTA